jgi:hypothetical protein
MSSATSRSSVPGDGARRELLQVLRFLLTSRAGGLPRPSLLTDEAATPSSMRGKRAAVETAVRLAYY